MSQWIFSAPWWVPTLIGLVGIAVIVDANRKTNRKTRNIGLGLLGLAAALAIVSFLVETDQEKVRKGTHQLIDAVMAEKWDTVSSLLEPDADVTLPESGPVYRNANQIVAAAKEGVENLGMRNTVVQSLKVEQTNSEYTVTVTLISIFDSAGGQPVPSTWQLDWVKDGNVWRVQEILAMQIGERTGPDMEHYLPK